MASAATFSGSYNPDDVEFLVTLLPTAPLVEVAAKEHLIQSGGRHYSEMLSPEKPPSPEYLALFRAACEANQLRLAQDCLTLAALIAQRRRGVITLVSLLRGGTPIGVIVARLLRQWLGRDVKHYSVSIIRGRGLDEVAMEHILNTGVPPSSIVFIDGWIGKGAIATELRQAVNRLNHRLNIAIDSGLYVVADLAGQGACAATSADYLIPSSLLNATVSGLISRSLLNEQIGPKDFHGCLYFPQLAAEDVSQSFVDAISQSALPLAEGFAIDTCKTVAASDLQEISRQFLHHCQHTYGITDLNLIKPGIGEATRVLLRRVPRLLILRDSQTAEVAHLRLLAADKGVPIALDPHLPYQAVSLIKSAVDD